MKKKIPPACLILISIFLYSCSATLNPNKFGREDLSPQSSPELTVTALGSFNEESEPIINIDINIDSQSLIYAIQNRKMVARTGLNLQIINEKNKSISISKTYDIKIKHTLETNMETLGIHKINKQFKLSPGQYSLIVSAIDKNTGRTSQANATASVPNPYSSAPFLTDIQLNGFDPDMNRYESISEYDLPAKYDTLRFVARVSIPVRFKKSLQMKSTLIQFASDTLPARPVGNANYTKSSIQFKGVNYYKKKSIQTINRKLVEKGNISVEFKYPTLERGNYRFSVQLVGSLFKGKKQTYREFGIRSKHFPLLKSPLEKAKPLVYLMNDRDYKQLLSITDSDSLEKTIDQFWNGHIDDKDKADEVKRRYYSRVLIANKEFTNFKEGWKTDQGMIFILFGNPWVIDKDLGKETWFYSYNRLNKEKYFTFNRTKVLSDSYTFRNYLLARRFSYNNVLYQQKRLWLSGLILNTQI